MKMKEACRSTSLTERAIRLYRSKGLISPRQLNGVIDFGVDDIRALKDIAVLRRRGFSIEQISSMLRDASAISTMISARMAEAQHAAAYEQETLAVLHKLRTVQFGSAKDFAKALEAQGRPLLEPNFAQFDEIDEEPRRHQTGRTAREWSGQERRLPHVCAACACALLVVGIAIAVLLANVRVDGFIPIAPCTVVELRSRDPLTFDTEQITLSVDGEWAREIIGRDVISLPAVVVRPVEKGQTLSSGVQLALEMTNLDLLRMGISPFHSFHTQSEDVNNAWLRTIIRACFRQESCESAKVWIGDISNKRPLFRQH